jgi:MoxR-like ATPase
MTGTAAGTGKLMAAISDEISAEFFERDDVVPVVVAAMLAGQHSLLLGPAGAAKSDMARALTGRIEGGVYWELLLGRFTDPKQIFGPIDVPALMRGEYTQRFAGHATEAHIAFIDEIFKCSDGALNSMLAFLNERLYHPENGGPPMRCSLLSAVTASNELPSGGETAAFYDRLLVRCQVEYLQDPSNFAALLRSAVVRGAAPATRTTVSQEALNRAIRDEVPAVAVPDGILDAMCQLRTALRRRELVCSDRRWKQSVRLLQAAAYLAGRTEVNDNDLDILRHVLWDSTADRRPVAEEVLTLVNPDARAALDLLETILGLERELEAKAGQSHEHLSDWATKEANPKLAKAGRELATMRAQAESAGRSSDTIDEVIARHQAVYARVATEALGIPATVVRAPRP